MIAAADGATLLQHLDHVVAYGPASLSPIYRAVRDEGCTYIFAVQNGSLIAHARRLGGPRIILIGDDLHAALGPAAFPAPGLKRLVAGCRAAVLISSSAPDDVYLEAASLAVLKRDNVVIVETRAEREAEWFEFLRDAQPDLGVLICCEPGGHA